MAMKRILPLIIFLIIRIFVCAQNPHLTLKPNSGSIHFLSSDLSLDSIVLGVTDVHITYDSLHTYATILSSLFADTTRVKTGPPFSPMDILVPVYQLHDTLTGPITPIFIFNQFDTIYTAAGYVVTH